MLVKSILIIASLVGLLAGGCTGNAPLSPETNQDKLQVVVTTGMLADAVREIGGDRVQVEALMGPGVDPHSYTASQGDVARLRRADLIVYNGLHLEGKMQEVLQNMAGTKPVLAFGEGLDAGKLRRVSEASAVRHHAMWILGSEVYPLSLFFKTADVDSRATHVAIALAQYYREHGHYPGTLVELVPTFLSTTPIDPSTGEPLLFTLDDNGHPVIYGRGPDGDDDGGVPAKMWSSPTIAVGEGDWVMVPMD